MPTKSSAAPDPAALARLPLFHGLSTADLGLVAAAVRPVRFPAGAAVLTSEQPGEVAYVVQSGTLRVSVARADGSEAILALLGPGEVVGELALLDRAGRSADVVALEAATLLWLDRTTYLRLRDRNPLLGDNLAALLARRLRLANQQILALATLDVPGRVARQLLALAEAYGEPDSFGGVRISLRLTQSDLAGLVGATRVRVNQALGGFKRRGHLIEDRQHRVTLLDPAALEDYCR
jgi:CRP/FNR family transcriptional regulator, cyclic AMP receptor protein